MTARSALVQIAGQMQGLPSGDTLVGVAGLPTASAAGQVPAADGAGTAYTARTELATVALASLPAASTALTGVRRTLSDDGGVGGGLVVQCDGTAWVPLAYDPPRVTLPTSDTLYLDGGTGASKGPPGGPGTTLVLQVWVTAAGSATGIVWCYTNGSTEGWHLAADSGTTQWYIAMRGMTGTTNFTGAITTGLNTIAIAVSAGKAISYSVNGAAATTIAALTGTYAAPGAASSHYVGRYALLASPPVAVETMRCRSYSTAVSGADLAILSAATGVLPTVTGTIDFDLDVSRHVHPGYVTTQSGPLGTQYTFTNTGALRLQAR